MLKRSRKTSSFTGVVVPLDHYAIESEIVFLSAVSYEERGFESLKRAVNKFKVRKVLLVQFNVQQYLDSKTRHVWEREKNRTLSLLERRDIPSQLIDALDYDFGDFFRNMKSEFSRQDTLVVDITTFPKNYILQLCRELERHNAVYQYTQSERYTELTEEEKGVGISKIIPIDGYEGRILLNKSALVVLILGFEGSRALPFLEEFPTGRIVALIGAPGIGITTESARDKDFIRQSEKSNKLLLRNSFVRKKKVNSLDPVVFCSQLRDIIEEDLEMSSRSNIIVVPAGTKAQALGLYLYWRANPAIQILYPLPNRRPLIALKTGNTYMYRLSRS